jgi:hypothetical protein
MSYESFCKAILPFAQPKLKEDWERLMLADQRDWNLIYREFHQPLSAYIGRVRLLALSQDSEALTELVNLENVFQWDEKFFADWEIQTSNYTHSVEYGTGEELADALQGNSYPDEDASDIWERECGSWSCYWSQASSPSVLIENLRMKQ